jgi:1-pyrroline-5-carboxylate dehydrogenase
MLSAYHIMRLLMDAGLPPGVVNLVPGEAATISSAALGSPDLAGIHFTGSTAVFQGLWQQVAQGLGRYRSYPRLVGETGGKDFVLVHPSADAEAAAVAIARGGYEYQGQKCSAASRIYVAQSIWPAVRDRLIAMMRTMKMGDVRDFRNFLSAVIDRRAFEKISGYLALAKKNARILQGGRADDRTGFFIEPTLVQARTPDHRLMVEEIFGPVVTSYVFPDRQWTQTLRLIDRSTPYALTGAVFARDRRAIREASSALRNAAGNFYINDKPTGAVVGQQPFGGARASGTDDKAGSKLNLLRWVNARTIKETFAPPRAYPYPFMDAE